MAMEDQWPNAFLSAFLLVPPTLLGVKAFVRGPMRFAGRVVPKGMNRLIGVIWLAAFPLTLAIVYFGIKRVPPRNLEQSDYLANVWAPSVLRIMSVLCLLTGGAIALMTARPEEKPAGKSKKKKKRKPSS